MLIGCTLQIITRSKVVVDKILPRNFSPNFLKDCGHDLAYTSCLFGKWIWTQRWLLIWPQVLICKPICTDKDITNVMWYKCNVTDLMLTSGGFMLLYLGWELQKLMQITNECWNYVVRLSQVSSTYSKWHTIMLLHKLMLQYLYGKWKKSYRSNFFFVKKQQLTTINPIFNRFFFVICRFWWSTKCLESTLL